MAIINITKENYEEVVNTEKTVLIDFWAPWCGPCRAIGPILEDLSEELSDVLVCKVNVDEQEDLSQQFEIKSIPALFVLKEGKITNKAVGALSKDALKNLL